MALRLKFTTSSMEVTILTCLKTDIAVMNRIGRDCGEIYVDQRDLPMLHSQFTNFPIPHFPNNNDDPVVYTGEMARFIALNLR